MASLPKSFNLAEPIPTLPDGATSQLITCRAISGSVFTAGAVIEVDLSNRGWLDPQSLAIRYKVNFVTDASGSAMVGTPVFTPFNRVSTLVGGASIDSISQYNQCAHVITNLTLGISDKYGAQSGYGYTQLPAGTGITGSMAYLDGANYPPSTTGSQYLAAPLIGTMLSSSEKQLPLFAMPQIRLQFTLDSLNNMFFVSTGAVNTGYSLPTTFNITNFEVVYNMCDMGAGVEKMVYDMGRQLSIKSHGITNSAVNVASATSGSQSYVFNQRFASIRSAFICPNRADGNGSKWAEIVDLTSNNGDYQLQIGNNAFPQMPLSTLLNESGILQETRRASGSLFDKNNTMSINTVEFSKGINDASNTLVYYEPAKFIVGVNLEKVQTGDHVLMSGASTYNTPISCIVNMGTATSTAANLNLILDYDAILVLDPVARQLSVRS